MTPRLVILLTLLAFPASASAVTYKVGPQTELFGGNCGPQTGNLAFYSQQTATGSSTGIEPKVGETFYVGVTMSFTQYFTCAADFWSAVMTLPAGVVPAIDATTKPICLRRAFRGGQSFEDPRMQTSCPTAADYNAGTRELRFGPKPSPASPDQNGFFFIGQRSPQESLNYTAASLLVPVKATGTVDQDVSTLFCTVGTECKTGGTVRMVVNANAAPANVSVALAGDVPVGAESARPSLTVNTTTNAYELRVAVREGGTAGSPFACGAANYQYPDVTGGGGSFEFRIGPDFDTPAPSCYLTPSSPYFFEVCHVTNTSTKTVDNCVSTTFKTSAITTGFRPPDDTAADHPDSGTLVFRDRNILTSHGAGSLYLRRKIAGRSDATFATSAATMFTDENAGETVPSPPDPFVWNGFSPWVPYEVQSCYQVSSTGSTFCGPTTRIVAGYMTAPADATGVTSSTATVSGLPSAPSPAGTLSVRTATTDPGVKDPRTAMTEAANKDVGATPGTVSVALTGLSASTKYWWVACFDSPSEAGIEDCSPARTFTTGAAPAVSPSPSPSPAPSGSASPSPSPSPAPTPTDTTKPTAAIKVKRKGRKLTITVSASDTSGVRSVTLKVGARKAKAYTKAVKVKRRKRKLRLVATVTDTAGNVTVARKTVRGSRAP